MDIKTLYCFGSRHRGKILFLFLGILILIILLQMWSYLHKCKITIENESGENLNQVQIILGQDRDTVYKISKINNGSSKTIYAHFVGESTLFIDYEGNPKNSPIDLKMYIESFYPYRAKIFFLPNHIIKSNVSLWIDGDEQ